MASSCLTIFGLGLDIVGVVIVWFFGWPQPNLEEGEGWGLEDGTPIGPKGETVAELNVGKRKKRTMYKRMSALGLSLLVLGFALQLAAQLL